MVILSAPSDKAAVDRTVALNKFYNKCFLFQHVQYTVLFEYQQI